MLSLEVPNGGDFRTPRAGEAPQTPIVGTVAWAWGGSGDIRWRHCVIFYTATEVGLSSNVRRAGGRHIIVEEVLHLYLSYLVEKIMVLERPDDAFGERR